MISLACQRTRVPISAFCSVSRRSASTWSSGSPCRSSMFWASSLPISSRCIAITTSFGVISEGRARAFIRCRSFSAKGANIVDPTDESIMGIAIPAARAPMPKAGRSPGAVNLRSSGLVSNSSSSIWIIGSIRSTASRPMPSKKLDKMDPAASLIPLTTKSWADSRASVRASPSAGMTSRSAVAKFVTLLTTSSVTSAMGLRRSVIS